jgi:hypothetical protein
MQLCLDTVGALPTRRGFNFCISDELRDAEIGDTYTPEMESVSL